PARRAADEGDGVAAQPYAERAAVVVGAVVERVTIRVERADRVRRAAAATERPRRHAATQPGAASAAATDAGERHRDVALAARLARQGDEPTARLPHPS